VTGGAVPRFSNPDRIFVSESWDHNVATNRARPLKMDEGISALNRGYSTGHV
jgi:hypothetical protein